MGIINTQPVVQSSGYTTAKQLTLLAENDNNFAEIIVNGAQSNIDIKIIPKGTGSVTIYSLKIPELSSTLSVPEIFDLLTNRIVNLETTVSNISGWEDVARTDRDEFFNKNLYVNNVLHADTINSLTSSGTVNVAGMLVNNGHIVASDIILLSGGSVLTTETVSTSANYIYLNQGEIGSGVSSGQSGIIIDRGSLLSKVFEYHESTDTFHAGVSGSPNYVMTTAQISPEHIPFGGSLGKDFNSTTDFRWIDASKKLRIVGDLEIVGAGDIIVNTQSLPDAVAINETDINTVNIEINLLSSTVIDLSGQFANITDGGFITSGIMFTTPISAFKHGNLISLNFINYDLLPDPTDYQGLVAIVQETGKMYYSMNGEWKYVLDESEYASVQLTNDYIQHNHYSNITAKDAIKLLTGQLEVVETDTTRSLLGALCAISGISGDILFGDHAHVVEWRKDGNTKLYARIKDLPSGNKIGNHLGSPHLLTYPNTNQIELIASALQEEINKSQVFQSVSLVAGTSYDTLHTHWAYLTVEQALYLLKHQKETLRTDTIQQSNSTVTHISASHIYSIQTAIYDDPGHYHYVTWRYDAGDDGVIRSNHLGQFSYLEDKDGEIHKLDQYYAFGRIIPCAISEGIPTVSGGPFAVIPPLSGYYHLHDLDYQISSQNVEFVALEALKFNKTGGIIHGRTGIRDGFTYIDGKYPDTGETTDGSMELVIGQNSSISGSVIVDGNNELWPTYWSRHDNDAIRIGESYMALDRDPFFDISGYGRKFGIGSFTKSNPPDADLDIHRVHTIGIHTLAGEGTTITHQSGLGTDIVVQSNNGDTNRTTISSNNTTDSITSTIGSTTKTIVSGINTTETTTSNTGNTTRTTTSGINTLESITSGFNTTKTIISGVDTIETTTSIAGNTTRTTTSGADGTITLNSKGSSIVTLNADTTNLQNTKVPAIVLTAEAGQFVGEISYNNDTYRMPQSGEYQNTMLIGTKTNNKLQVFTNGYPRITILDGVDSAKTNGGIIDANGTGCVAVGGDGNNGNIGIGTIDPQQRLHVVGNQLIDGSLEIINNLVVHGCAVQMNTEVVNFEDNILILNHMSGGPISGNPAIVDGNMTSGLSIDRTGGELNYNIKFFENDDTVRIGPEGQEKRLLTSDQPLIYTGYIAYGAGDLYASNVPSGTSTTSLTQDQEQTGAFVYDENNDRLGIGLLQPQFGFDVQTITAGFRFTDKTATQVPFVDNNTNKEFRGVWETGEYAGSSNEWRMGTQYAHYLNIKTTNKDRLTITPEGKLIIKSSDDTVTGLHNYDYPTVMTASLTKDLITESALNANLRFYTNIAGTRTHKVSILNNGNVGIGNLANIPSEKLVIDGNAIPLTNQGGNLGVYAYRWKDMFLDNTTVSHTGILFVNTANPAVGNLVEIGANSRIGIGTNSNTLNTVTILSPTTGTGVSSYGLKVTNLETSGNGIKTEGTIYGLNSSSTSSSGYAIYGNNSGSGYGLGIVGKSYIHGSTLISKDALTINADASSLQIYDSLNNIRIGHSLASKYADITLHTNGWLDVATTNTNVNGGWAMKMNAQRIGNMHDGWDAQDATTMNNLQTEISNATFNLVHDVSQVQWSTLTPNINGSDILEFYKDYPVNTDPSYYWITNGAVNLNSLMVYADGVKLRKSNNLGVDGGDYTEIVDSTVPVGQNPTMNWERGYQIQLHGHWTSIINTVKWEIISLEYGKFVQNTGGTIYGTLTVTVAPSAANDVVRLTDLNTAVNSVALPTLYLQTAGGTISGNLTVNGTLTSNSIFNINNLNISNNLEIGSGNAYLHSDGVGKVSSKFYIGSNAYLTTTSGFELKLGDSTYLNCNGNKITSLAYPLADTDGASKKYVDDKLSTAVATMTIIAKGEVPMYYNGPASSYVTNDINHTGSGTILVLANVISDRNSAPGDWNTIDYPTGFHKWILTVDKWVGGITLRIDSTDGSTFTDISSVKVNYIIYEYS